MWTIHSRDGSLQYRYVHTNMCVYTATVENMDYKLEENLTHTTDYVNNAAILPSTNAYHYIYVHKLMYVYCTYVCTNVLT